MILNLEYTYNNYGDILVFYIIDFHFTLIFPPLHTYLGNLKYDFYDS